MFIDKRAATAALVYSRLDLSRFHLRRGAGRGLP